MYIFTAKSGAGMDGTATAQAPWPFASSSPVQKAGDLVN
jgi:hypothetical protein